MVRDEAEIGGGQGGRGGPGAVQGHPPPYPQLQGRPQHVFSPGPPCASPAGLPGVGAMTGGQREASGQQPGLPPLLPERPSLHLCLTPPEGHPPESAIPGHTAGLQGSSWVASPGQDVSPGPGQSRERLRRAGPPPGTRQLWEQVDQGAQGVQPGTSARKRVGDRMGPCKVGVARGNRGEVREATGAREGLVRVGMVSTPPGPPIWTQVSLSELSLLLNLV